MVVHTDSTHSSSQQSNKTNELDQDKVASPQTAKALGALHGDGEVVGKLWEKTVYSKRTNYFETAQHFTVGYVTLQTELLESSHLLPRPVARPGILEWMVLRVSGRSTKTSTGWVLGGGKLPNLLEIYFSLNGVLWYT